MCLGIPGHVTAFFDQNGARMGKLNFGGILNTFAQRVAPGLLLIAAVAISQWRQARAESARTRIAHRASRIAAAG
jgi:hydrogenase maturation factor